MLAKKAYLILLLASAPSFLHAETATKSEDELIQDVVDDILKDLKTLRDAHPKAHGCFTGKMKVLQAADPSLQVGLFANPGDEFEFVKRSSSGSSDPKAPDQKPGGTGLAVKILLPASQQARVPDLKGEAYFLNKKYYKTFDIITINALHEFMVEGVADYKEFFDGVKAGGAAAKAVLAAGGTPQQAGAAAHKEIDRIYLHLTPAPGQKSRPREDLLMTKLNTTKIFDPTADSYQSWVPSMLGENMVKYQIRPCERKDDLGNAIVKDPFNDAIVKELNLERDPNFLRGVLKHRLAESETCFTLAVQKHLPGFPSIEDAVAVWPRDKSPYVAVAELLTPKKEPGQELIDEALCDTLSFNPAHATPEHRPVGGIQRARSLIYAAVETARNLHKLEEQKKLGEKK